MTAEKADQVHLLIVASPDDEISMPDFRRWLRDNTQPEHRPKSIQQYGNSIWSGPIQSCLGFVAKLRHSKLSQNIRLDVFVNGTPFVACDLMQPPKP